jgi:hypothetical protein
MIQITVNKNAFKNVFRHLNILSLSQWEASLRTIKTSGMGYNTEKI